ncbi:unnamed protein product [Protopolystoma xenopodis]|uniref:Uncharacterized protein n=1 Tax=Protopolystoma xenopodis TaxID=117903 RepID=A0A448X396_9PLAT|nr:unnamed protein product [Protopolystoma xenopodis]
MSSGIIQRQTTRHLKENLVGPIEKTLSNLSELVLFTVCRQHVVPLRRSGFSENSAFTGEWAAYLYPMISGRTVPIVDIESGRQGQVQVVQFHNEQLLDFWRDAVHEAVDFAYQPLQVDDVKTGHRY